MIWLEDQHVTEVVKDEGKPEVGAVTATPDPVRPEGPVKVLEEEQAEERIESRLI